ncbi:MAG: alpha/beta fold hydrolase [Bryobacterales bacterium]|nr:alpha/beta fold hydrolase [Bryobacterales bacterium]
MFQSIPRWLRIVVYTQLALVIAIPLGGWLLQSIWQSVDARTYLPPGEMVPVGSHRIHMYCEGERGSAPLVVFNAGVGDSGLVWRAVQKALNGRVRSCAIDRAGLGWSDPGDEGRGITATAQELRRVLAASGEKPPYLVVGHGLGALHALVFMQQTPQAVEGLVLVDPLPPDCLADRLHGIVAAVEGPQKDEVREKLEEIIADRGACPEGDGGTALLSWLARFGMIRVLAGDRFDGSAPMPEMVPVHRALKFRNEAADAMLAEAKAAYVGLDEARHASQAVGGKPVLVFSPGQFGSFAADQAHLEREADPSMLAFERAQLRYLQRRQAEIAAASPLGTHRIASKSDTTSR